MGRPGDLSAQPPPQMLALAASKIADSACVDRPGMLLTTELLEDFMEELLAHQSVQRLEALMDELSDRT